MILGILPSLTVLSARYEIHFPTLFSRTGPFGVLKLVAPLVAFWVALGYRRLRENDRKRVFHYLGGAWIIGSVCTIVAAIPCGIPSAFLREWAVITVGLLAGLAMCLLPETDRNRIFRGWFAVVFISIALDAFFPSVIDWLYSNVFDPDTRKYDVREAGVRTITGVFGRQSLAKLMAWLPWLVLPGIPMIDDSGRDGRRRLLVAWTTVALISGFILATSQRGPALASFCALAAFGLHPYRQVPLRRRLIEIGVIVTIGLAMLFLTVPREIVAPRVLGQPVESTTAAKEVLDTSRSNVGLRGRMIRASIASIAESPLGNACIPENFFKEYGIGLVAHSHHLFLEQFRSRGWLWGGLHLALWLVGGIGFWRRRDLRSAAYFAGWVAIVVSGMFDHPWFVLNHSIVLGVFLVEGLSAFFSEKTQ